MGTQRGAALPVLPGKPRAFNPPLGVRRKRTAGCGFCSELRALGRMNPDEPLPAVGPSSSSLTLTRLHSTLVAFLGTVQTVSPWPEGPARSCHKGTLEGRGRQEEGCRDSLPSLTCPAPRRHPSSAAVPRSSSWTQLPSSCGLPRSSLTGPSPLWVAERTRAGTSAVCRWLRPQTPDPRADRPSVQPRFSASLHVTALWALETPSARTTHGPEPDSGRGASTMGASNRKSVLKAVRRFLLSGTHICQQTQRATQ